MATSSEKKILVVDDEPDVRFFLATCIQDAGFMVESAGDGVEAMEKLEKNPPDLMTLDMIMPRKSGIELIRSLRKVEKWKNLPIIIITAHAKDEFGSKDIKSFNAFTSGLRPRYMLEKPVTPEKLINSICDILNVLPKETIKPAEKALPDEALLNLIKNSDPHTREKIKSLLDI